LPGQWKDSIIVPIYKKGDETNCSNYHRISMLSTSYKILTNILLLRLLANISVGFDVTNQLMIRFFHLSDAVEKTGTQ
jgi:hypothetical protein